MNCPYCDADLTPSALSCKACGRDVSVVRPLLERIERLEKAVAELKEAHALAAAATPAPAPGGNPEDRPSSASVVHKLLALLLGMALLVGAHALFVVWLDLPLVWLRVLSVAIPLGAGVWYGGGDGWFGWRDALAALVFACGAVAAMNAVVAAIDSVPILPRGVAGWRETIVYALSIFASFVAGALARRTTARLRASGYASPSGLQSALSSTADKLEPKAIKGFELVAMIVSTLVSAIVAIVSAVSGLLK